MIKGSNRRMFRKSQRKPGAAKKAIGILASSQELMNTVEPVRMSDGGFARIEQLQQQLESLMQQRQRLGVSPASSINPLTGVARPVDSGIMQRRALAASALDQNIAQTQQQLEQEMTALGEAFATGELPTERREPDTPPRSPRRTLSGRPPVDPRGFSGSKALEESVIPALVAATTVEEGKESPIRYARTGGRPPVAAPKDDEGGGFFSKLFGSSAEASDKIQDDNAQALAEEAGILPKKKDSVQAPSDEQDDTSTLTDALNKLGKSEPQKDTSTADLMIRIGLNIAAGDDPRALKNIASGTLKALQESEQMGILKGRQRPKLQQTLEYFQEAGLSENEIEAVLPYVFGTTTKSSESERVAATMAKAAAEGDVATLTTILVQQQGRDADVRAATDEANRLIDQYENR